ncbi:hypothetical protein QYE76_055114 [Lolium multiflorum]|uniref:poly(A)-specific ribonuclease n=1 Tax=Lolium multiflorum TaxID=4521 RepID=A0AAD8WP50_LOLMU|nr:hypothetical protein QYE76_055114 [Lolium multiflorum]
MPEPDTFSLLSSPNIKQVQQNVEQTPLFDHRSYSGRKKTLPRCEIRSPASSMDGTVRSVWADNFKAESRLLHQIAPRARHVALNMQYPGCVFVHGNSRNHRDLTAEERYELIRANVALLMPLQVGIAVRTDDGRRFAWEFNLRGFDITSGKHARDPKSVAYLTGCGVDFSRLPRAGIDGYRLRWLLRDSGLIRARPSWATFAGAYHVAYFVTMMYGEKLPHSLNAFMEMVRQLIGRPLYDVKRLAREHDRSCVGALSNVVGKLTAVPPGEGISKSKPAGTGSIMALLAFETLKKKLGADMEKYRHELCGLQVV